MGQPASVQDILAAFHLGEASAEPDVAAALQARFGLADDADLVDGLRDVPPGEVLTCLAAVAAPVAAMVRELYAWMAEIDDVRATGNVSVRLSDDQMTALTLDPEQYLVTDGRLEDDDIAMLSELDAEGHTIHVHLVDPDAVTRRELTRYQV